MATHRCSSPESRALRNLLKVPGGSRPEVLRLYPRIVLEVVSVEDIVHRHATPVVETSNPTAALQSSIASGHSAQDGRKGRKQGKKQVENEEVLTKEEETQ